MTIRIEKEGIVEKNRKKDNGKQREKLQYWI